MVVSHCLGMTGKSNYDPEMLEVVWAIVLIQGAITLLTAIEATVGSFALGSIAVAAPVILMSVGGGALALASARGIRRRRRWARRTTVVAEYLVLGSGVLATAISLLLARSLPGLVTFVVAVAAPVTVLVAIRRYRGLFGVSPAVGFEQ